MNKKASPMVNGISYKNAQPTEARKRRKLGFPIERPTAFRETKSTFLIVCEGKNTEPSYFEKFKLPTITLKAIWTGCNTLSLIEEALRLKRESISSGHSYDEIWCVFDADPKRHDSNQIKNFNAALVRAKKEGLSVAYSHQAFEYWLILHFEDHQWGHMERSDYNKKLRQLLKGTGASYDGSGTKRIDATFFKVLMGKAERESKLRVEIAVQRAKRRYNELCSSDPTRCNPGWEESSTTVFMLVEKLLKNLKNSSLDVCINKEHQ